MKYKKDHSLQKRRSEAVRIRNKYPDRIPVVCERYSHSDAPEISKSKYLVPCDLTVGQFMFVIRKRLALKPDKALFLLSESGKMLPSSYTMSQVYESNKDIDGFLYFVYATESTFG